MGCGRHRRLCWGGNGAFACRSDTLWGAGGDSDGRAPATPARAARGLTPRAGLGAAGIFTGIGLTRGAAYAVEHHLIESGRIERGVAAAWATMGDDITDAVVGVRGTRPVPSCRRGPPAARRAVRRRYVLTWTKHYHSGEAPE